MKHFWKPSFFLIVGLVLFSCKKEPENQAQILFSISEANNISPNSATFDAFVAANTTIADKGICYSLQNNTPTIADFKISSGNGTGNYNVTLTDLIDNTVYFARPYAIADGKTYYGEVKKFRTLLSEITIVISNAINISPNSAIFDISVDANISVSDKGICYSSQNNAPTTGDSKISNGSGIGNFRVELINLMENTLYYVRPYVIANGISYYGECKMFTTLKFTYSESVVINGIHWSTRNVNMPGKFAAKPEDVGMLYQWNRKIGWSCTDPIVNSNGGTEWDSSEASGNNWSLENSPCPSGWRVPTTEELESLASVTSSWGNLNGVSGRFFGNGENVLFLPAAGYRYFAYGYLYDVGSCGTYWSSNMDQYSYGAFYLIFRSSAVYSGIVSSKPTGQSVRCVAK